MSEFDLIRRYFTWEDPPSELRISVGDDAAVLSMAANEELIISVDTSVSGVHFPIDTPAHAIGYKSLATNLSDLAAMGATPRWFTLALTLPEKNEAWLSEFARGLRELADSAAIFLIGGDTTRGPLSITIQVMGSAPKGTALLRSGAQVGDLIAVSGYLGEAAAGLAVLQQGLKLNTLANDQHCLQRLNYPTPRLALGEWLRVRAHSCMDISDGLLADLNHLLTRSQVGAELYHQNLSYSPALQALSLDQQLSYMLTGGDDYELLFTIPPILKPELLAYGQANDLNISIIGIITETAGELVLDYPLNNLTNGYNHF